MKQILVFSLLLVVAASAFTLSAQAPAEKQRTFLSSLNEGQPVSIKEVTGRYEISTLEGVPGVQGYKVVEVANDYVVIQDIAGISESRIPVYSIKAIIKVKVPGK